MKDPISDVIAAARGVRYKTKALREALKAYGAPPTRELLEHRVGAAERDLHAFRAMCAHPRAVKVARSNVGNYDPSADRYWYACECPDCGRRWSEDQ